MAKVTGKKDYTLLVAGGIIAAAGLGLWYLTKPEWEPPPDGNGPPPDDGAIETRFENLVVGYDKMDRSALYLPTHSPGLEWDRERFAHLVSPVQVLPQQRPVFRLVDVVFSPQIDCYPGDTIRSTFVFDFRGEAATYRFEVMMTHGWYTNVALVWENRTLPRTEEITMMTEVFETQITLIIRAPTIGTHYGAQATIHGAIGDIIWTPNVLEVFRVFPGLTQHFANLNMQYQRV